MGMRRPCSRCDTCHTEYGGIRGLPSGTCPRCRARQADLTRPVASSASSRAPLRSAAASAYPALATSSWGTPAPPLTGEIARLDRALASNPTAGAGRAEACRLDPTMVGSSRRNSGGLSRANGCRAGALERPSLEAVRVQVVLGHPLQADAVDLAGRVERHLVEEDDLLRRLVADRARGRRRSGRRCEGCSAPSRRVT